MITPPVADNTNFTTSDFRQIFVYSSKKYPSKMPVERF